MNRRTFLQVVGAGSALGLSGCSEIRTSDEDSGTHRHSGSSTVWVSVPKTVQQTIFIPDVVVKNGRVNVLTTVDLELPDEAELQPQKRPSPSSSMLSLTSGLRIGREINGFLARSLGRWSRATRFPLSHRRRSSLGAQWIRRAMRRYR